MTTSRYRAVVFTLTIMGLGFASTSSHATSAQPKVSDKNAIAHTPIPAKNVIGQMADGDALFVDPQSFDVAKGKAKGKSDPNATIQKLRAGPLPEGAIIFRSGGKLYLAGGARPQFMYANPSQYMAPNPSQYMYANPSQYMYPNPSQYMYANPSQYMAPNPSQYMYANPSQYMYPDPAANVSQYMQPVNPSAYMQPVNPSAYMQPVNPSAYMQPTNPSAYMRSPNPASYMKSEHDANTSASPAQYMRNAFEDNFEW